MGAFRVDFLVPLRFLNETTEEGTESTDEEIEEEEQE